MVCIVIRLATIMVKCMRTRRKFKVDFLENKASNEKNTFHIFDLLPHVRSPAPSYIIIDIGTFCIYYTTYISQNDVILSGRNYIFSVNENLDLMRIICVAIRLHSSLARKLCILGVPIFTFLVYSGPIIKIFCA